MELTQCLTPRTIRRRRLLRKNETTNPELESLYQDDSTIISPPVRNFNFVTLGTPSQQYANTPQSLQPTQGYETVVSRSNDVFGPSLSLTDRLNKIVEQDSNTKKAAKTNASLDLSTYRMVPSELEEAFSAAPTKPIFSRQNFFDDPPTPEIPTPQTPPPTIHEDDTPVSPASPASSVNSTATSISEQANLSLLSWPCSPCSSPRVDRQVPSNALTFGRINLASRFPSNNTTKAATPLSMLDKRVTNNMMKSPLRSSLLENTKVGISSPILDKPVISNPLTMPSSPSPFDKDAVPTFAPTTHLLAPNQITRPSSPVVQDAPLHRKARRSKRATKKSGPLLPRRWTVRRSRTKCRSIWIESPSKSGHS